jgi:hypothetical protein
MELLHSVTSFQRLITETLPTSLPNLGDITSMNLIIGNFIGKRRFHMCDGGSFERPKLVHVSYQNIMFSLIFLTLDSRNDFPSQWLRVEFDVFLESMS